MTQPDHQAIVGQIQMQAAVAYCAQALLRASITTSERDTFLATVLEEFRTRIGIAHITLQHCFEREEGWFYSTMVQTPDPTVSRSGTPATEVNPTCWASLQAGVPYSTPAEQMFRDGSPNHIYWQRRQIVRIDLFPIMQNGRLWGVVSFGSPAPYRPVEQQELSLLGALADMVGAFIRRVESQAAIEQQLAFEQALAQCSRILLVEGANSPDWGIPVKQALAALRCAVGCNRLGLNLYPSPGDFAPLSFNIADQAADSPPFHFFPIPPAEVPARSIEIVSKGGWVIGSPQQIFEGGTTIIHNLAEVNGIRSLLIVGILIDGAWRGHFMASDRRESWVWDEPTIRTVHTGLEMIAAFVRQRELQLELERARDAAEAANTAKSAFLATMSHEIRTPLNAVLGMAHLLRDTNLSSGQRSYISTIATAGQALLAIITNILDFSRGDAGRLDLEMQPFDLDICIAQALELVAYDAQQKGLALKCQVGADVPQIVIGDMNRLRQLLLNLLANAVKFSEHGTIVLSATASPHDDQQLVTISITDNGIGMTQAQIDHIFEPFVQADSSTTRRYGGTGLGLAISQQLIQLMGGEVTVVSEPGIGSTFRIAIPFHTPAANTATATDHVNAWASQSLRILVAEDNPINQQITRQLLIRQGHQVTVVANGQAALMAVEQVRYDVVLMDIHMPDLDGEQATRQIRSRGTAIYQPYIIALTANAQPGDRERFQEAGMNEALSKPVQLAELQQALSSVPVYEPVALPNDEPPLNPIDTTPKQLIDWGILNHLVLLLGPNGQQTIATLIQLFEQTCPQQIDALDAALISGDQALVYTAMHQLRGGCLQMGAQELADLCNRVAQTSDVGLQVALAKELRDCYKQTLAAFQQY